MSCHNKTESTDSYVGVFMKVISFHSLKVWESLKVFDLVDLALSSEIFLLNNNQESD